jgi:hypothetical protein
VIVGFTGARDGLTEEQHLSLVRLLTELEQLGATDLHHGDCVGADATAATEAHLLGYRVVSHPPANSSRRAFAPSDVVLPEANYLDRNQHIVDECDLLIACPSSFKEQLRSGTWSTVRRARRSRKPVRLVRPDGSVRTELPTNGDVVEVATEPDA